MNDEPLLPNDDFSKLLYANAIIKEQSLRIQQLLSITKYLEEEIAKRDSTIKNMSVMSTSERKQLAFHNSTQKLTKKIADLKEEIKKIQKLYDDTFADRITQPYIKSQSSL